MKKKIMILLGAAAMLFAVPETMAGHHGHRPDKGNDGLKLAAGIVHLVKEAITPAPRVIYAPPERVAAPPPARVIAPPPVRVVAPPPKPAYHRPAPVVRRQQEPKRNHPPRHGGHRR